MKKIPTLFKREYSDHKVVGITPELSDSSLQVVLDGLTIPTLKVDGSCCTIIDGFLYKRYDAKKGKQPPAGAIPCQPEPDEITGHWPHWVKCDSNKVADKWYIEAYYNYMKGGVFGLFLNNWTYEAVGPHFQGNPYKLEHDVIVPHAARVLNLEDFSFEGIRAYLFTHIIEGIVFWYRGEPICKIKRSDFGYEWPVKGAKV